MIFVLGATGSRETKLLNFKRSRKPFTQDTKLYQIPYIVATLCDLSLLNPLIPT